MAVRVRALAMSSRLLKFTKLRDCTSSLLGSVAEGSVSIVIRGVFAWYGCHRHGTAPLSEGCSAVVFYDQIAPARRYMRFRMIVHEGTLKNFPKAGFMCNIFATRSRLSKALAWLDGIAPDFRIREDATLRIQIHYLISQRQHVLRDCKFLSIFAGCKG